MRECLNSFTGCARLAEYAETTQPSLGADPMLLNRLLLHPVQRSKNGFMEARKPGLHILALRRIESLVGAMLSLAPWCMATPIEANAGALASANGWHGCGAGIYCNSDSDCQSSSDCVQTAGDDVSHIHCGQDSYPHSCWAF
ncbi:hypothetical protein FE257_004446 [Aspergillus nanangensis]|uniref:Uncharacterized protein n=1 Tax=Aspergillus nanangensis TaxID=2582783 RepID=A0AAD4CY17_ASPNN|nr:hypothetical protein FE257_004446 [Aspergillus nanangensis]